MENVNTLREKLATKLESGELSKDEYDELVIKLEKLDLMSSTVQSEKKSRIFSVGFTKIDDEEIDGPVKVSGKLVTTSSLTCQTMSISGSASIAGDLKVIESTKISGRLSVEGSAKFGGQVKISGKLNAEDNIYCTEYMKVSGKVNTNGDLVLGGGLKIAGKLYGNSIRSTGAVKVAGNINIDKNVLAQEFISSGGKSIIGGNLTADLVEIAKDYRVNYNLSDLDREASELDSIPALGTFVTKVITSFIPQIITNNRGNPGIFSVMGNVRADNADISYAQLENDIIGKNVIIGPEVVVGGVIKYVDSIEILGDLEYNTQQIGIKEYEAMN